MAGGEEKTDRRDELDEPDQAERERAVGQRVHLPADRDCIDLKRDRRGNPHVEEADIGRVLQQTDGRGIGGDHSAFSIEHDPEKWKPVFRKDHAPSKR
jgi:hypothetical protein